MSVKISDLLPPSAKVEVSPGKFLELNPLNLQQIVKLFWAYQDAFLSIYAEGSKAAPQYETLLFATPEMCVDIIAMAADAVGQEDDIRKMPGTVQLAALAECWRISVPDAKKLKESLSGVMAGLQKLNSEAPIESTSSKI